MELNYSSVSQLIQEATKKKVTISSLVLNQQAQQMELSQQELYKKMLNNYQVMKSCITPGCAKDLKSTSGLTGGDAWKMKRSGIMR